MYSLVVDLINQEMEVVISAQFHGSASSSIDSLLNTGSREFCVCIKLISLVIGEFGFVR